MYEDITFDSLMERMLARVPSTMDKREGSIIWDAIAPVAVELSNYYIALQTVLNETFPDTASLYYLIKRAAERGIEQTKASAAVLQGEFTPVNLEVPIGSRFSCNTLNYVVTEKISSGVYKMTCETVGTEGNEHFGTLIPIEYIEGLESANLTGLLIPAEDDEDVESLRERYFNSMVSQAFGGNVADYVEKVTSIQGVGGVKVTPVWNGGGTVKLTVINSDFQVPSTVLIDLVQTTIDPVTNSGEGLGLAPIGHSVTVVGVRERTIGITANITYQEGWNWESAKSYILNAIDQYFYELSTEWDEHDNLIVRISQLESRILDCPGVIDVADTTFNGSATNLSLNADEIPVRGIVNGN